MEFAPNGTLTDKIRKTPERFLSEKQAKRWFRECVEALCCMQDEHHMAHRDIKTDNVLFDDNDNAKLSDFGFAREFNLEEGELCTTYCGTLPYYAPEVLAKRPYNPFLFDVWSMGVMLFVMLNGKFPFKVDKKNREASLKQMKAKDYKVNDRAWGNLSDSVKDLINAMFTFNPDVRPNIVAVRKHAWFSSRR